jgi:hypothetical protein
MRCDEDHRVRPTGKILRRQATGRPSGRSVKRPDSQEDRMAMHLPRPIEIYFASDTAHDTDALATCFAVDATVRDEGRTFEGLAAITAWRTETKKQYRYTVEPVEAVQRDGQTVVTARASGDFPGSPVTLTFIFRLERAQITSLEIRS